MPFDGSAHFAVGPIAAGFVVGLLVLISRWAFGPSKRRTVRHASAQGTVDYGLLVPVLRVATTSDAERARDRLERGGVRGTVSPAADGDGVEVLVFRRDEQHARELVG